MLNKRRTKLKILLMMIMISLSCGSIIAQMNYNEVIDLSYNILLKRLDFNASNINNYNLIINLKDNYYNRNTNVFDSCNILIYDSNNNLLSDSYMLRKNNSLNYELEKLSSSDSFFVNLSCNIDNLLYHDYFEIKVNNIEKHILTSNKQFEIDRDVAFFSMDTFIENFFLVFIS